MIPTSSFKTTAPAECNELRKSLIVWAQNQATGYRTQAAIANRKHVTDKYLTKADSFGFVVKYLQGMEIINLVEQKICPDTKLVCEENCSKIDCHLQLARSGAFDLGEIK